MSHGTIARVFYHNEDSIGPQSPTTRPEELQITPCYTEESDIDPSIRLSCDHHYSNPSSSFSHDDHQTSMTIGNAQTEMVALETNFSAPRKAYMDLTDAIALLDETCPNPDASPFSTPKTPRTPLTPHPKNKRARSKSSDNASNLSQDPLHDHQVLNNGLKERGKKRPFLRRIGISKTEDRPFLSKIVPRIGIGIGKPYLERIGSSKTIDRPSLDKVDSSKTLDKFTFDTQREPPISTIHRAHAIKEVMKSEKTHMSNIKSDETNEAILIVEGEAQTNRNGIINTNIDERNSSKVPLLKMYSFETEDLDEICSFSTNIHSDPVRGTSLNNILKCESNSVISLEKTCDFFELPNFKSRDNHQSSDVAQLVKCRVTTSDEIISLNTGNLTTPRTTVIKSSHSPHITSDNSENSGKIIEESMLSISPVSQPDCGSPLHSTRHISNNRKHVLQSNFKLCHEFELQDISVTVTNPISETQTTTAVTASSNFNAGATIICNNEKYKSSPTKASIKHTTKINTTYEIRNKNIYDENKSELHTVEYLNNTGVLSVHGTVPNNFHSGTVKSVLKKQQGIDESDNQVSNDAGPSRRSVEKIFHEASLETMELVMKLRKVKSLLKTPSDEDNDWELDCVKPARVPKKISLSDKEFSLSMEYEHNVCQPSRLQNSDTKNKIEQNKQKRNACKDEHLFESALFEGKCSTLDYADDVAHSNTGIQAINPALVQESDSTEKSDIIACDPSIICDSGKCLSNIFTAPTNESQVDNEHRTSRIINASTISQNHFLEVDIAIPIDETKLISPKRRAQKQGVTSDLYEIISPRATPLRVKKRLGRISVEEAVIKESFTIGKIADSRAVINQRKTKCFPL